MKRCNDCKQDSVIFYRKKDTSCKFCILGKVERYHKTKNGICAQIFSCQKSSSKGRGHTPPKYTKIELSEWLHSRDNFDELYNNWVKSKYDRWLKPSIDRLDDSKGYSFDNIRLVTWDVNHKSNKGMFRKTFQYSMDGMLISSFISTTQAYIKTGIHRGSICECLSGVRKTAGGYKWEKQKE